MSVVYQRVSEKVAVRLWSSARVGDEAVGLVQVV